MVLLSHRTASGAQITVKKPGSLKHSLWKQVLTAKQLTMALAALGLLAFTVGMSLSGLRAATHARNSV